MGVPGPLGQRRLERPALLGSPQPDLGYSMISNLLVWPIYRILLRGRTTGLGHVPRSGGLVVVANHGSHLDPPIISHAIGRPVAFMAKEELFRVPLLGPLIKACGAYPVARGASDREALRTASERLAQGWATGVFLDGTRQHDGRIHAPQAGAALLAARLGVPLLPVAILNSHRALGRTGGLRLVPVHIRIGPLIPPPASRRRGDLDATTQALQRQINDLLDAGPIKSRRIGPPRLPEIATALPPSPSDRGH